MEEKIFTRRDFLRGAAGATVAAALGPGILGEAHSPLKDSIMQDGIQQKKP